MYKSAKRKSENTKTLKWVLGNENQFEKEEEKWRWREIVKEKIYLLTTTQQTNKNYFTNQTSFVLKLDNGNVVIINPVAINRLVADTISSLGPVSFVVSNNSQNNSHFSLYKQFFPHAKSIGISPENKVENNFYNFYYFLILFFFYFFIFFFIFYFFFILFCFFF
jgi:hypothetical protein